MQDSRSKVILDRLLVGLWYSVASIMASAVSLYWIISSLGRNYSFAAASPIDLFKHSEPKNVFLFAAAVGVFPLLLGIILGAPALRRPKPPGAMDYIGRGALVTVLSLVINMVIYTVWVGFGPVLIVLLPFALVCGWVAGGLLYLVRGRKLRQNTE